MEFTGERFMPENPSDWGTEHHHRYIVAADLCHGKKVLDVASGEGYGSAFLATVAASVTGVDVSEETILFAQQKYSLDNLQYIQGSAAALPFEDNSFDVVVSFETIEHLTEQEAMMDELARVLRPEGLLIISSPDKLEYTDVPQHENEYHVKELYRREFEALIEKRFSNYTVYGQRLDYGSLIISEATVPFYSYEQSETGTLRAEGLTHAMFHIILASQSSLPVLTNSIYKYPLVDSELMRRTKAEMNDWKTHALGLERVVEDRDTTITGYEQQLGEVGETLTNTRLFLGDTIAQLTEAQQDNAQKRLELEQKQHEIEQKEHEYAQLKQELEGVYASRSWRITSPLRRLAALFRS